MEMLVYDLLTWSEIAVEAEDRKSMPLLDDTLDKPFGVQKGSFQVTSGCKRYNEIKYNVAEGVL